MTDPGLAERVERIEAHLAIQQLPLIRYAMAVDARDIDAWVNCFRPDVNMGRHGIGRDVLRRYIDPRCAGSIARCTRSAGTASSSSRRTGPPARADCRAEHEVGDQWIVMAICYFDEYARVDGEWFFSRRRERHWYAADVIQTPQSAGFAGWDGSSEPALPGEFGSWARFWDGDDRAAALTKAPAGAGQ